MHRIKQSANHATQILRDGNAKPNQWLARKATNGKGDALMEALVFRTRVRKGTLTEFR
jgi:hypothetical protein